MELEQQVIEGEDEDFLTPRTFIVPKESDATKSTIEEMEQVILIEYMPEKKAESTNKTIIQNLKKRLDDAKGKWKEVLPEVLRAYRTTLKSSMGATLFSLVYGSEALIPIEVRESRARFRHTSEESNHKAMNASLELLDEK
uniref:Uncharacterized protein LOC104234726 n=1 Tax=Nicotiana sylvestris TaxID=4096 RepID=A0A1U7XI73_NICSY|nr:PREDICTED: uncharacterized protein LOC104234726 [Nicotiana sylvestris]